MIARHFFCGLLVLATLGAGGWAGAAETQEPSIRPPFDMPEVTAPVFPDRTVDIRDHGAVGDGTTLNTASIARAIAACAEAGGGHVLIPRGTWLTGAIHLKSNIDLHLEAEAVLRFSTNPDDYLPVVFTRWAGVECYNYSPLIYARDCTNIAVTGAGQLDGQGEPWWPWVKKENASHSRSWSPLMEMGRVNTPLDQRVFGTPERGLRPQFLSPIGCKNVLIEGISLNGGPFWTIDCIYCENVLIRQITIDKQHGPNNDGIDIDSSKNVVIEHSTFNTADDCIVLKSGINEDGRRVGRPTENVVIRHCHTRSGHGGVVLGSETSGGIRNVLAHDCDFDGTRIGIRIKSNRSRGGFVENIWVRDITMDHIVQDAIIIDTQYSAYAPSAEGNTPPRIRGIHLSNIVCHEAKTAMRLIGMPEQPLEDVSLENCTISAAQGVSATDVTGLSLVGCRIETPQEPVLQLKNCRQVREQ